MRASSTPVASKNKVTIREVFFWALLFIFASQVGFHFLIGSSPRFDEQCSADSALLHSPRCTEVILFQKWHADALAAADPDGETLEELLVESTEEVVPADLEEVEVVMPAVESIASVPQDDALRELIVAMAVERPDLAAWVSSSSAAPELLGASHSETDVPQIGISGVETQELINATGGQESGTSDWGQNLIELQESLETRMHSLRSFRKIEDSQLDTGNNSEKKATHMTAWARDLQALQHHMEKRASDMAKAKLARREIIEKNAAERRDRAEKRHASHVAVFDNSTLHEGLGIEFVSHNTELEPEIGKPLMQRIFDLGRELCSEPERRDRPSCVQFLVSSRNDSSAPKVADSNTFSVLHDELPESNYELVHSLKWPAVRNWKESSSKLRGYFPVGVVTARHDELRRARWAGMIPKVACVSVVPSGHEAKYQMKYFVNNFRLQTYEGPRQLILVYDHNDKAAKQLVGKYADGVFIRSAAARSDGKFPSTTAYRFGAYVADADVIARWDFDAWHHPDRLAMQVRALAHKTRPVNRLLAWTLRNGTEDSRSEPDESVGEASLVGEKAWMAEHWHPLLGDETATLTSAHLRYLVQLDMPGLIVYSPTRGESS
jgi:hypothetical protein